MTTLIAFPFRLDGSGSVAAADDQDDDYMAAELAMLVRTRPEERVLVPSYGMPDPAFESGFDGALLQAQVETFGPPVIIEALENRWVSGSAVDTFVTFRQRDDELDADETSDATEQTGVEDLSSTADDFAEIEDF